MLYGKTYMKFDKKENKEYIYSKDSFDNEKEVFTNSIGKTFIDFLSNSDDIIKAIEDDISHYKRDKLKNIEHIHTLTKFKLGELNPLFIYFDYDDYLSNYIEKLKDKNNIVIKNHLESIRAFEEEIKDYKSKERYNDELKDEISYYHDYDSKESKEAFYYIDKSGQNISKKIEKFIAKYGYKPSYNTRKKIWDKDEDYIKGEKMIKEIEDKIYNEHELEIKKSIEKDIKKSIKNTKSLLDMYKHTVKDYVKSNERTLEEVFKEHINTTKFWIGFSKYILIHFYNLTFEKYDNDFSSTQRLLDYLLHINRTYFSKNIFEVPQSNMTLELHDGKRATDLSKFIEENKFDLLDNKCEIFNQLNTYRVSLVQEYAINSIEDFITVSLMQILQNNIKICKCENCDKLFISTNKSNEKYCTYEFKDHKTCRDLSYSIHLQKDNLANLLRKKYRTENAKKIRNKHIPNIQVKFDNWYSKAKEQKRMCEKGNITFDDFNKWFEDNSKWF